MTNVNGFNERKLFHTKIKQKADYFIYLGSNITFAEKNVTIGQLLNITSDFSDIIKQKFFQAVAMSVLLYVFIMSRM